MSQRLRPAPRRLIKRGSNFPLPSPRVSPSDVSGLLIAAEKAWTSACLPGKSSFSDWTGGLGHKSCKFVLRRSRQKGNENSTDSPALHEDVVELPKELVPAANVPNLGLASGLAGLAVGHTLDTQEVLDAAAGRAKETASGGEFRFSQVQPLAPLNLQLLASTSDRIDIDTRHGHRRHCQRRQRHGACLCCPAASRSGRRSVFSREHSKGIEDNTSLVMSNVFPKRTRQPLRFLALH